MSRFLPTFFFVIFLSGNLCAEEAKSSGTEIMVVDIDNRAFNAEVVRWWYLGEQNSKHELKCFNKQCDKRFLKKNAVRLSGSRAVVISAETSVVLDEDASCWRLFYGEILLNASVKQAKIVMLYKNKACKSLSHNLLNGS